jgi:hypothetical protein
MATTFTLSGTLKVTPRWVDSRSATDITDTTIATNTVALDDGTASGQANAYWKDQLSINAGASVTIDLRSLSHKAFGGTGTLAFAAVKMLMISNNGTGNVVVGGTPANRWSSWATGNVTIGAGCVLFATNTASGWATTTTEKTLQITNSGAAVALVDIYVAGVKA